MSSLEQMQDNLSCMVPFRPLNQEEQAVLRTAREALARVDSIRCTSCRYCLAGCPRGIPIPDIFSARNRQLIWGRTAESMASYQELREKGPTASDCLACGRCEQLCPQHLEIISLLRSCAQFFGS